MKVEIAHSYQCFVTEICTQCVCLNFGDKYLFIVLKITQNFMFELNYVVHTFLLCHFVD